MPAIRPLSSSAAYRCDAGLLGERVHPGCEGSGHTRAMVSPRPGNQRAQVGKASRIGARGANGTDPTLVGGHSSPVARPGDGGRHGSSKSDTHEEGGTLA